MAKIFGNGARIRRTNQQARVDALLAESASANGTPVTRAGDRRQVPPELPQ